jgi:hypothetical protein
MTRALTIGAATAALLAIAGCAQPYPQYAYGNPYAYPAQAPAYTGGAMTAPLATTANAPIPDTPENRARYGGPESRAGKRSPYERPYTRYPY